MGIIKVRTRGIPAGGQNSSSIMCASVMVWKKATRRIATSSESPNRNAQSGAAPPRRALDGVRVLAPGNVFVRPAPDQIPRRNARIIKVEKPGTGDMIRAGTRP